ncbi:hypothetical protein [Streptomyces goshikiensis]|uniref:hypothetical protein n=1 Tax=Streptomyces goshikiensis TaxID=1942 RepID=UPI0033B8366E
MSDAMYGLIGALGGSLSTAAAAFWGPLRVQRQALREQREQSSQAQRLAQEERDSALRELEAARLQEQRTAAVARVVLVRTSTAAWHDLLDQKVKDISYGPAVDLGAFDQAVMNLRGEARTAIYHALYEGLWIPQTSYGYPAGQPLIMDALDHATELVRESLVMTPPRGDHSIQPHNRDAIHAALSAVMSARAALSQGLLQRIEALMNVTVIGPRMSRESTDGTAPSERRPLA